jgi:hypothetical protein
LNEEVSRECSALLQGYEGFAPRVTELKPKRIKRMDLLTKIKLFLSPMKKENRKIVEAIISTTDTGSYAVPGYNLVISSRKELEQPIRGVFRNFDTKYGIVIGPQGLAMLDPNQLETIEIMKFLIKWNIHVKEKYAGRYKEARRNGDPRPRGRDHSGNSGSDQG